jgi:Na+/proline symporter
MTTYDYGILTLYFVFMLAVSWVVRRLIRNAGDYFRSGGEAMWWMTGGTIFMVSFSAWTFTGAASRAYADGWPIAVLYLGNAIALFIGARWFGPQIRHLRVVTPVDAVRLRFGAGSEQFFTWVTLPVGLLMAGVWLYGLAIFLSAAFHADLVTTIIATGVSVLLIALLSGSWAVMAGDFVQVLVLMPVTLVILVLTFTRLGGVAEAFRQIDPVLVSPAKITTQAFLPLWCGAMILRCFFAINNLSDASRYLCVKNTKHASWAGYLAAGLMLAGVGLWFLPPMAVHLFHPNLSTVFPGLANPAEGAYFAIARDVLPIGALGLFVSGVFAATMSSMDSGLNKNAGVFVKNFYVPVVRPQASDSEQLRAGKIATLGFGIVVILLALFYTRFRELSLFQIMIDAGTLLHVPLSIPQLLGLYIRRTPPWSGWSTVLVACGAGLATRQWLTAEWAASVFSPNQSLSAVEAQNWDQAIMVLVVIGAGTAWFMLSALFYRYSSAEHKASVAEFGQRLATPVTDENSNTGSDDRQSRFIGWLCIPYGSVLTACALVFPNSPGGKGAFTFCGAVIVLIGAALVRAARRGRAQRIQP